MTMATDSFACTSCGRSFRWKPELAGKRVRCKCGTRLHVPDHAPVAFGTAAGPEPEADNPLLSALDALIPAQPTANEAACPSCGRAVAAGAKICIECGTNLASGRRVKTKVRAARPVKAVDGAAGAKGLGGMGVKIAGTGLLLQFVGVLLILGGMIYTAYGIYTGAESLMAAGTHTVTLVLILLGLGLFCLGPLLCVAAPGEAGRGPLVVAIAIAAGLPFATWGMDSSVHPFFIAVMWVLGPLIAMVCVTTFCQQLAGYLEKPSLEESAASVIRIIFGVVIGSVVTGVVTGGLVASLGDIPPALGIPLGIVNLIIAIAAVLAVVRYVHVTGALALAAYRH